MLGFQKIRKCIVVTCTCDFCSFLTFRLQWGSEIRPFKIRKNFKVRFPMVGLAIYSYGPNPGPFENWAIQNPDVLSGFQIVFDKMSGICLDFRWFGFRISDPIQNPDQSNPTSFRTFKIQISLDFRSRCTVPHPRPFF